MSFRHHMTRRMIQTIGVEARLRDRHSSVMASPLLFFHTFLVASAQLTDATYLLKAVGSAARLAPPAPARLMRTAQVRGPVRRRSTTSFKELPDTPNHGTRTESFSWTLKHGLSAVSLGILVGGGTPFTCISSSPIPPTTGLDSVLQLGEEHPELTDATYLLKVVGSAVRLAPPAPLA